MDFVGKTAVADDGRNPIVVFVFPSRSGTDYLSAVGIQMDFIVQHRSFGGFYYREHCQTRYSQQGADARPAKSVVRAACDYLHVFVRHFGSGNAGGALLPDSGEKDIGQNAHHGDDRQLGVRGYRFRYLRNADGRHLGKRSLGTLLELGPERDVGGSHMARLFDLYPLPASQNIKKQHIDDHAACRVCSVAGLLVRRQLPAIGTRTKRAYLFDEVGR